MRRALLLATALTCAVAAIADEDLPDADFLEYLGSWNESDEDWLALAAEEGIEVKELASDAAKRRTEDDDENDG